MKFYGWTPRAGAIVPMPVVGVDSDTRASLVPWHFKRGLVHGRLVPVNREYRLVVHRKRRWAATYTPWTWACAGVVLW